MACTPRLDTTPDPTLNWQVSDDARRISRDFYCSRALLLSHMRYFAPYLTADRGHNEIDISVHCDIDIFEWLVE